MATALPIGGKIVLTPEGPTTPTAMTFDGDDVVFGSAQYSERGTDIQVTVQNGDIERYRQSIAYEVSFETYGDDTDADTSEILKCNTKCECYEDDGATPVGTTFYGSVRMTYDAGTNTTRWTVTGNTEDVP